MASKHIIWDSITMFKRCGLIALRKPDALATSIFVPTFMMLLFVFVLGNAMDVGAYDFISFIVPGVILQCIGQCATVTSIVVNEDLTKGIFDRFRSMPIAKSAVMTGHVLAATIRNIIATTTVIGVALLIGFRPQAGFLAWLAIAGLLLLFMMAITWLSLLFGMLVKSAESAGALAVIVTILPYLSSGFVPVESMAPALQGFARHQPMTPVIDTVRALSLGLPVDGQWLPALLWCLGIILCSYLAASWLYRKKMTK